jgi:hypothetical protein
MPSDFLVLGLSLLLGGIVLQWNRVLRRIFGPKRDEVTRECRK